MAGETKTPITTTELEKAVGGNYIPGSAGDDAITGTVAADAIESGAGDDLINALDGDDYIATGEGQDRVAAGAGNDSVFGGEGDDILVGDAGADYLQGDAGNDILIGGVRDGAVDIAYGGDGDDGFLWSPGSGSDQFFGEAGHDRVAVEMSLNDLKGALQVEGQFDLTMNVSDANVITFTDRAGQPVSFNGTITVGGETLRFSNVEQINLV